MFGMIILAIGAILQFMSYGLAQLIVGRVVSESSAIHFEDRLRF